MPEEDLATLNGLEDFRAQKSRSDAMDQRRSELRAMEIARNQAEREALEVEADSSKKSTGSRLFVR